MRAGRLSCRISISHSCWYVHSLLCLQALVEEAEKAPASCKPALRVLAALHGATRLERGLPFFLACKALEPCCVAGLRDSVNALCR